MPRFFFHLVKGVEHEPDDMGLEFASLEIAYLEAFTAAREMWHELFSEWQDPTQYAFDIADKHGRILLHLPFSEVLDSVSVRQGSSPPSLSSNGRCRRSLKLINDLGSEIESARATMQRSREILLRSRGPVPH